MQSARPVVVVGAAAAGITTAVSLRRHGYGGEIVVIGDEPGTPYDRPPLSKQVLSGEWDPARAALLPPERLAAAGAQLRLGVRAESLDIDAHELHLADGSVIGYGSVVVATGVRPRTLPDLPARGVHTLRTLDDCLALKADLVEGATLVVVGAGFLGLEVAATARKLGVDVTVIEPFAEPMANRLGTVTAARLLDEHRAAGVRLHCGVSVAGVGPGGSSRLSVSTVDGRDFRADVVLLAIGSLPNVEWLHGSGLTIADGIECDAYSMAAPDVWVAGDVALWPGVLTGQLHRMETRTNATTQGESVGQSIAGGHVPYNPVPYFWTDQYDARVQVAGYTPVDAEERVEFVDDQAGRYVRSFWADGRLVGAVGWNAPKAFLELRRQLGTVIQEAAITTTIGPRT